MRLFISPRQRWPFWLALGLGWLSFAGVYVLLGLSRHEPHSQIATIACGVFIIGFFNTLAQRELSYRLGVFENTGYWVWIPHTICSLTFGLISALAALTLLAYYYIAMNFTKKFVFFDAYLYPNWVTFSLLHGLAMAVYSVSSHYGKLHLEKQSNLEIAILLKESQIHALSANLNPHFLFNSLNNIRGLILEDAYKARAMLTNLSDILRSSLKASSNELIPLTDELATARNYIELSKIQYDKRLEYKEEIKTSLHEILVPPMLLQILLENAIKHGIDKNKCGGVVKVCISSNEKFITIETHNPVASTEIIKKDHSNSTQIGLKNIEKRLNLIYGKRATFEMRTENATVICIVNIPMHNQ